MINDIVLCAAVILNNFRGVPSSYPLHADIIRTSRFLSEVKKSRFQLSVSSSKVIATSALAYHIQLRRSPLHSLSSSRSLASLALHSTYPVMYSFPAPGGANLQGCTLQYRARAVAGDDFSGEEPSRSSVGGHHDPHTSNPRTKKLIAPVSHPDVSYPQQLSGQFSRTPSSVPLRFQSFQTAENFTRSKHFKKKPHQLTGCDDRCCCVDLVTP